MFGFVQVRLWVRPQVEEDDLGKTHTSSWIQDEAAERGSISSGYRMASILDSALLVHVLG